MMQRWPGPAPSICENVPICRQWKSSHAPRDRV